MSDRYPGGIIVANPTAPTTTSAPGIWTLEQAAYYIGQGTWPLPPYFANNSLRFRASASAYLQRTPASAGSLTTWTWSGWVKRGALGGYQTLFGYVSSGGSNQHFIDFGADTIRYYLVSGGSVIGSRETAPVYRDPSAWYHVMAVWDTTQATAANRMKLYVNGTQITTFGTSSDPAQNTNGFINSTVNPGIGSILPNLGNYFDGYLAEVNFVDGQALTPSSFGITSGATGVWQPKLYTGSYGTNGYYLPFSDTSALTTSSNVGLGKDFSGNGNYFATNNISITSGSTYDAMTDVPTLTSATVGNYCVMNPLDSLQTVADGNLAVSAGATWYMTRATIGMSSGKWYWETQLGGPYGAVGISKQTERLNQQIGETTGACGYVNNTGEVRINNVAIATYSTWSSQIIGMAYDADNGKLWFSKDGTWLSGDPAAGTSPTASGLSGTYFAGASVYSSTESANFGQRPFTYTPPSGYIALNTYNLPTPTIIQGDDYFLPVAYSGNSSTRNITTGFAPDFVWVKPRSAGSTYHGLYDIVRGAGKRISTNATDAEATNPSNGYVTAFNSTSFSLNTGSDVNATGTTYASWNWKAGGSSSSNTDGSITSTVSANQTSGFSVVTYTGNSTAGATVGHGLGRVPAMIIIKSRTQGTADWQVFHQYMNGGSSPWNYSMYFNTDGSQFSYTGLNSTAPTSSIFTLGSNGGVNQSGADYVAYVFAEIPGYSSFGKYTGNGSTSGPFVYTGFRPAFVLAKSATSTTQWGIMDNARDPTNNAGRLLFPNLEIAEEDYTSSYPDLILSNGFRPINNGTVFNQSSQTYIYASFAENPFKYALAR